MSARHPDVNLREQRSVPLDKIEVRTDAAGDEIRVKGHAAVIDKTAWIGPPKYGFSERFAKGAFAKSIADKADVRYLFNHNPDKVLARTRAGTLSLAEDKTGLATEANIAPTTDGRNLAILLERGDVSQMSVGFQVVADTWEEVEGKDGNSYEQRTITEVKLFDVSAVTYPAYEETDASLRQTVDHAREIRDARGGRRTSEPAPASSAIFTPPTVTTTSGAAAITNAAPPETSTVTVEPEPATATPPEVDESRLAWHDLLIRHAHGEHVSAPRKLCRACKEPATATP